MGLLDLQHPDRPPPTAGPEHHHGLHAAIARDTSSVGTDLSATSLHTRHLGRLRQHRDREDLNGAMSPHRGPDVHRHHLLASPPAAPRGHLTPHLPSSSLGAPPPPVYRSEGHPQLVLSSQPATAWPLVTFNLFTPSQSCSQGPPPNPATSQEPGTTNGAPSALSPGMKSTLAMVHGIRPKENGWEAGTLQPHFPTALSPPRSTLCLGPHGPPSHGRLRANAQHSPGTSSSRSLLQSLLARPRTTPSAGFPKHQA